MMNTVRIQEQTGLRLLPVGPGKSGIQGFRGKDSALRTAAMGELQRTADLYGTAPHTILARRLCSAAGYSGAVFAPNGAEAKAQAVALARAYSTGKYGEHRTKILVLTDRDFDLWLSNAEGCSCVRPNDLADLEAKLDGAVCALMVSFSGMTGTSLTSDYVKGLFRLCRTAGVLTISDETDLGLGRAGTLLAGETFGVKPDMTVLSKNLPLGICLTRGGMAAGSSAYVPTLSDCAETLATLNGLLAPGALDEIRQKALYLKEKLLAMPALGQVHGLGLALSAVPQGKSALWAASEARDLGLSLGVQGNALVFCPDLHTGKSELAQSLALLNRILSEE